MLFKLQEAGAGHARVLRQVCRRGPLSRLWHWAGVTPAESPGGKQKPTPTPGARAPLLGLPPPSQVRADVEVLQSP